MSEELNRVIICRSAKESLKPGARIGYECCMCQEALQLTPGGFGTLLAYPGSRLFCNDCGLLYVQLAEDEIKRTEMSPAAKSQLAAGNKSPLARWVRKHA